MHLHIHTLFKAISTLILSLKYHMLLCMQNKSQVYVLDSRLEYIEIWNGLPKKKKKMADHDITRCLFQHAIFFLNRLQVTSLNSKFWEIDEFLGLSWWKQGSLLKLLKHFLLVQFAHVSDYVWKIIYKSIIY